MSDAYYMNLLIGTFSIVFLLVLAAMFFGLKDPYIEQRHAIITQVECANEVVCKVEITYTYDGEVYRDVFWMPKNSAPVIGKSIQIKLIPSDPRQYKLSWNTKLNGIFVIGSAIIVIATTIFVATLVAPETQSTS